MSTKYVNVGLFLGKQMMPPSFEGELDENCAKEEDENEGGGIIQGERRRDNGTVADVRHLCDNDGVIAGVCSSPVKHLRTKIDGKKEAAGEKGEKGENHFINPNSGLFFCPFPGVAS